MGHSRSLLIKQHLVFHTWLALASRFVNSCKIESLKKEYEIFNAKVEDFYGDDY